MYHALQDPGDSRFYHKVQRLIEHVERVCGRLIDPGSILSYDEAMIRFMSTSSHTILASFKPITKGHEAMLLATPGHSHDYVFIFYLRGKSNTGSGL